MALAGRPEIVVLAVLPVVVTLPGNLVMVQLPLGKPLKATLAVEVAQVGCVIVPTIGAAGSAGCAFTTALGLAIEVQPALLATVKV